MTLAQVIPRTSIRDTETGERIELPPLWEREEFELDSQPEAFSSLAIAIKEQLGERALVGYRLSLHSVAQLTVSEALGGTFWGLKIPHRTLDGATGTMDTFATHPDYPDRTFFEHTFFFGRGADETHSDPRPLDAGIERVVTATLGRICDANAVEIRPIRS